MSETVIRPGYENPRALILERKSFWEASVDGFTKPPAQVPDKFEVLEDVEPIVDNRINRRRGYTLLSNPVTAARRMFELHFTTTGGTRNRLLLTAADQTGIASKDNRITVINENGDLLANVRTPAAAATVHPYVALSREFAYIMDGASADLKKWDGDESLASGSLTDWGLSASGAVFTAVSGGAGNITAEVGRRYMIAFLYTPTGEAVLYDIASGGTGEEHSTDSVSTGPLTDNDVDLASLPTYTVGTSGLIAASIHRIILATSDGGPLDTLYEVGRITDNTTTTFTDNLSEDGLLASPIWAEITQEGYEVGIYDNTRPSTTIPTATLVVPHRGRLYAITEQFLFWSKNLAEQVTSTNTTTGRYESSWPPAYQLPLAKYDEFGRGLLSDEVRLYIATDRNIRVLDGDYPFFNGPRTLFHEVGLMRQDTWKTVYHEGQQVGAIWLTPDRRIIASDFNTYGDIGVPIQHILKNISVSRARLVANATFVSDGPYELYCLAVPAAGVGSPAENDTLLIYDVRRKRWYVWKPSEVDSTLGVPGKGIFAQNFFQDIVNNRSLWTFSTNNGSPVEGRVYRWYTNVEPDTASNLRDRNSGGETPLTYDVTIKTGWLDWGLPQVTKFLNEVEVMTGDSALTITIEGASTDAAFSSPTTVMSATTVAAHAFGQYKIGLAAKFTKFRFYRFTFTSPAGTSRQLLDYFAIEAIPFHRF